MKDRIKFGKRTLLTTTASLVVGGLLAWSIASRGEPRPAPVALVKSKAVELLRESYPEDSARELVLLSVSFPPGAASLPHQHPGFIVGYVLTGELEFQLAGQPLQLFTSGYHFYEPSMAPHLVARNPGANTTEILAFTIQEKGKPVVIPMH